MPTLPASHPRKERQAGDDKMWIANCFGNNAMVAYSTQQTAEKMAVELFGSIYDNKCSFGEVDNADDLKFFLMKELSMSHDDDDYAQAIQLRLNTIERAINNPGVIVHA